MPLAPLALIVVVLGAAWYLATRAGGDAAAATADAAAAPGAVAAAFGAGESLAMALGRTLGNLWSPPAAAAPYASAIAQAEQKYGLPSNLLARQLDIESNHFDPQVIDGTVRSRTGAIGIGQFMPATAAERSLDPTDPWRSIDQAAADMRAMYDKFGSWAAALAAYNWGQGNVQRKGLAAAPAETREYIAAILGPLGLT